MISVQQQLHWCIIDSSKFIDIGYSLPAARHIVSFHFFNSLILSEIFFFKKMNYTKNRLRGGVISFKINSFSIVILFYQFIHIIIYWYSLFSTSSFSSEGSLRYSDSYLTTHLYFPLSFSSTLLTMRRSEFFLLSLRYFLESVTSLIFCSAPSKSLVQKISSIGWLVLIIHSNGTSSSCLTTWLVSSIVAISTSIRNR